MPTGIYKRKFKGIYKKCLVCGKIFYVHNYRVKIAKYCSRKCHYQFGLTIEIKQKLRKITLKQFQNGMPKTTKQKIRKANLSEKSPRWKGNNVRYFALHSWVKRHKRKCKICKHCGKTISECKLYLSSKTHQYTRNLNEYQYLCASCHKIYDLKNNLCKH